MIQRGQTLLLHRDIRSFVVLDDEGLVQDLDRILLARTLELANHHLYQIFRKNATQIRCIINTSTRTHVLLRTAGFAIQQQRKETSTIFDKRIRTIKIAQTLA